MSGKAIAVAGSFLKKKTDPSSGASSNKGIKKERTT
jgi:hypothetical protein